IGRGFGPRAQEAAQEWADRHNQPLLEAFVAGVPSVNGEKYSDVPSFSGPASAAAGRIGAAFASLREKAATASLAEVFDDIVQATGYRSALTESEEDLDRWANLLELRADLERYDSVDPAEALAYYLEQIALIADVDSMNDDARGQVTLITLHSAKGLEFPVVFITGIEEGLLPISRAIESEWQDPTALEEERRLFYVGVTRAEKLLYLTYAANRMSYGRYQSGVPSRFLEAIPAEHVKSVTRYSGAGSTRGAGRLAGAARGTLASKVTGTIASAYGLRDVAPAPAPIPTYTAGQKVFHPKFGEGIVNEVLERRSDQEVVVTFERFGTKRLMASLAQMDSIE
ncbi:MAG TPA: 3'-5' exonuclease, partial [Thermomicrobiales bacterium]|nr:3'-5' exonuclease [Thermomicrobiales bacterium]